MAQTSVLAHTAGAANGATPTHPTAEEQAPSMEELDALDRTAVYDKVEHVFVRQDPVRRRWLGAQFDGFALSRAADKHFGTTRAAKLANVSETTFLKALLGGKGMLGISIQAVAAASPHYAQQTDRLTEPSVAEVLEQMQIAQVRITQAAKPPAVTPKAAV